jgi:hypothetical protein
LAAPTFSSKLATPFHLIPVFPIFLSKLFVDSGLVGKVIRGAAVDLYEVEVRESALDVFRGRAAVVLNGNLMDRHRRPGKARTPHR